MNLFIEILQRFYISIPIVAYPLYTYSWWLSHIYYPSLPINHLISEITIIFQLSVHRFYHPNEYIIHLSVFLVKYPILIGVENSGFS